MSGVRFLISHTWHLTPETYDGQEPTTVTIGRVAVVAWPGQGPLAARIAEIASSVRALPGLGSLPPRPISIILAPTRARFDSLTGGSLPAWSDGAAFPGPGVIVLFSAQPPDRLTASLRHELAHLALHWHAGVVVPLWFQEGYASVAAREWGRFDALRVNWTLARGRAASLDLVDRALRGNEGDASDGYALATTAVLLLERWGGERGLTPLMTNLAQARTFDAALRVTHGVTEAEFEERWRDDLRSHYGWLAWGAAAGLFWSVIGGFLVWLAVRRRRRVTAAKRLMDGSGTASDDAPTP